MSLHFAKGYSQYTGEDEFQERFSTEDEIKSRLTFFDLTKDAEVPNQGGMPIITDTKTAYVDSQDYHTLILGSTGSKKTRLFVLPTIFTLGLAGEDLVINDAKGELYNASASWLQEHGYKVDVINFRDLGHSENWNPFVEPYIQLKKGEVNEAYTSLSDFAHSLLAVREAKAVDPFWTQTAASFVEACIQLMYVCAKDASEINMSAIASMVAEASQCRDSGDEFDDDAVTFEDILKHMSSNFHIKTMLQPGISSDAKQTRQGVLASLNSALSNFFNMPALRQVLSRTSIDLHDFGQGKKKHALFIIVPDEKSTFNLLTATLIKQLYSILIDEAAKLPGERLPVRVNFVLDEFANLPMIPNMANMITAARSRNVRFYLVVQSNSQLEGVYGHETASTIKTNCLTWVFLSTKEMELVNEIREALKEGKDTDSLVSVADLTNMDKEHGQALIYMLRARPYMTYMPDIADYTLFFPVKDKNGRNMPLSVLPLPVTSTDGKEIDFFQERIVKDYQKGVLFKKMSAFFNEAESSAEEETGSSDSSKPDPDKMKAGAVWDESKETPPEDISFPGEDSSEDNGDYTDEEKLSFKKLAKLMNK